MCQVMIRNNQTMSIVSSFSILFSPKNRPSQNGFFQAVFS